MGQHKKRIIILALVLHQFFIASALAATPQVTTTLDRSQISAGETFKLTLTINGEFNSETADTTALEKDFIIVSSMVAPQMTVINGAVSQRTEVNLMLAAKRSGKLIIPSISIGKYSSTPQTITVSAEATKSLERNKQLAFLDAEIDNKFPVVQSQVIYRIRLFYATNISRGTLSEPNVKNAIVMPLGDDKEYQKTINGTMYQVHERLFALFPQRSGTLTIEPIIFSGMKSSNLNAQSFNQFLIDTQIPVRLVSPSVTLEVKPIPPTANQQNWLPSKDLSIEETWSFPHQSIQVGDPITRSIKIRAKGNTTSQLPKLNINSNVPHQVNVYSDNLKTNNSVVGEDVIAESQQDIAYIPSQAGEITLPEITLPWWDSINNQARIAKLPSKIITLVAQNTQPPAVTQNVEKSVSPTAQTTAPEQKSIQAHQTIWPTIALFLLLIWIATLIIIYRDRIKKYLTPRPKENVTAVSEKQILRQLKVACQQQDALQVKHYLEAWGKYHWPEKNTVNLGLIAKEINDQQLSTEISNLSTLLYSTKKSEWSGERLWQAFQAYHSQKSQSKKNNKSFDLPPLYPRKSEGK